MFIKFQNIKRIKEITYILSKYGFNYLIDNLKLPRVIFHKKTKLPLSRAERIRFIFEELGTTFIKFGQIISTHPEIIPEDIIIELKKLQDNVPPFKFTEVEKQFIIEFKKPVKELFKEFQENPIASASIGQVHLAKLYSGQKVIIKIQRPNLKQKIKEDLDLLLWFATLLEKKIPESKLYNPINLVNEFKKSIERELKFETEAHNLEKMQQLSKKSEYLYFPKIYWKYTNNEFLTMDYVSGIKIDNIKKLKQENYNCKLLAKRGAHAIFEQIFIYGFFHADPHSGNIFILPQNKICFIDYGMVGYLNEDSKLFLSNLLIATLNKKEQKIIECLLEENLVPNNCDLKELKTDIDDMFIDYYNLPLNKINIWTLLREIIKIISKHHIQIPNNLLLVIKDLITIEGIGRQLDSNFNPTAELKPFISTLIKEQYKPKKIITESGEFIKENIHLLKILPKEMHFLFKEITQGNIKINFEHHGLNSVNQTLNHASNLFAFSIITASLLISSALIIQANIPPLLWDMPILGVVGFILAGILGIILLISIIKKS